MAEGVWKGVYPQDFGRSRQLSLNKFFDPSTPSMRKGRNGEKKTEKKNGKTGKKKREENTDENSGHYVIASSRPPERRPPMTHQNEHPVSQGSRKIPLIWLLLALKYN